MCIAGGALCTGAAGLTYAVARPHGAIRPGLNRQLAPDDPRQGPADPQTGFVSRYRFQARATFEITALVLSTRAYRKDSLSDISPVDLALGWGQMSNPSTLDDINIWQRNRFYFWRGHTIRHNPHMIAQNSANMHIVPVNDIIHEKVGQARRGDIVSASGRLIDLRAKSRIWRTSLTRKDSGAGGCEIFLVDQFDISSLALFCFSHYFI